jgi:3-phenylpropionate/trans-cinnamate dioxygenase ferredoxin reductase subunit
MPAHRIVVIGAGLAALRTVQALRRRGSDASVTLVGSERQLPYDRPPLSKSVLVGSSAADDVALTSAADIAELDVDLRLGVAALDLDVAGRRLVTTDGAIGYDDAVIATGSSARRLPHLADLDGVYVLRTVEDAVAIRAALQAGPRVVVIGGGFIGAEVASSARSLGLDTTIVDPLPVLMYRGLGPVLGRRATELHRDAGVRLRLGAQVTGLTGTERVTGVTLDDGTELPAELVVIGVGAAPNVGWLASSGLALGDGVVCDAYLRAAPGIYAVGDVARWHHDLYGETVRAEHWTAAVEHADAVGATLTGEPTRCVAIPLVWSDQHGVKFQIAGRVHDDDEVHFALDEPGRFLALTGSHGVQHAAVAMSAPAALIKQRRRLAEGASWPPDPS